MIENYEDLAIYLDARDPQEETLSRRIYNVTECGAWLKFVEHEEVTVWEKWIAVLDPYMFPGRVKVFSVAQFTNADNLDRDSWISASDAPEHVKFFLSMDENNLILEPIKNLDDIASIANTDFLKAHNMHLENTCLFFRLRNRKKISRPGIQLGSIVEGSDVECETYTLHFPFYEEAFSEVIKNIEEEARDLWQEANGEFE